MGRAKIIAKIFLAGLIFVTVLTVLFGIYFIQDNSHRTVKTRYLTVCPQDVRRRYIEEACKSKNLTGSTSPPDNAFVIHSLKLVYCLIPKAASRTMRSILGSLLTKNSSYNPDSDFSRLPDVVSFFALPPDLRAEVIRTYKKLIVVRHPYDRIVSVFSSKLSPAHRRMIKDTLGKKTKHINRYLTNIEGKKIVFDPTKDVLTFEEFVGVLSSEYNNGFRNNHWNAMFEHCLPCNINYDFILRLETLEKDYPILAYYLQPPKKLRQSAPYEDKMRSTTLNPEEKLFNLHWRYEHLGSDVLTHLRNIYEYDLDIFGYTWDDEHGADCRIPLGDGRSCC